MTETQLRQLWHDEYCAPGIDIRTFDNIQVRFYSDMFDHAFYESYNAQAKDKSILSLNRCEKMLWIKEALMDPDAIVKKGWIKGKKVYSDKSRVTLIKENYIVVIRVIKDGRAKFVTAYEVDNDNNVQKILQSPDWGEE